MFIYLKMEEESFFLKAISYFTLFPFESRDIIRVILDEQNKIMRFYCAVNILLMRYFHLGSATSRLLFLLHECVCSTGKAPLSSQFVLPQTDRKIPQA